MIHQILHGYLNDWITDMFSGISVAPVCRIILIRNMQPSVTDFKRHKGCSGDDQFIK